MQVRIALSVFVAACIAVAMSSSIAIVTGSNKGIGFAIVEKLLKQNIHCIVACRSHELGSAAVQSLQKQGYTNVEFKQLDISDEESIDSFVHGISAVDILVNNAAIAFKDQDPTPFAMQAAPTFNTNYFGTINLTMKLLPVLKKSKNPRIINVTSQAGMLRILKSPIIKDKFTTPTLTINELNALATKFVSDVTNGVHIENNWPNTCYGMSKLCLSIFTKLLAEQEKGMKVNCCCPGYCDTDMSSHRGTRSPADGATTPVFLALNEEIPSGKFFYDCKEITL